MSFITDAISNPKNQVLFAAGGVITRVASHTVGPLSWPLWAVTAVASQAFVFGLDALVRRCLQSASNRDAAIPVQIPSVDLQRYNGMGNDEEAALEQALMNSRQDRGRPYDEDLSQGLALSRIEHYQMETRAMRTCGYCTLAELMGEELPIPQDFYILVGEDNKPYHAGNLVLGMLCQPTPQDPFRTPIPNETFEYLAQIMGIDSGAFQSIWSNADTDPSLVDIDPGVTVNKKIDNRLEQLHLLLRSKVGTHGEIQARQKFLAFLETQDLWSRKFVI
jgi:hypothetical protein